MRTYGDLLSYWGAVAQIIPVLALAFVLDARIITRRLSRKSQFKRRKARIGWSVLFFIVVTSLTVSEYEALQALAYRQDRELTGLGVFYFFLSFFAVALSLLCVLTIPVGAMISAATIDANRLIGLRFPWGKTQRLKREIERDVRTLERQMIVAKSDRLDALMVCTDALLEPVSKAEIERSIASAWASSDNRSEHATAIHERLKEIAANTDDRNVGYSVARYFHHEISDHVKFLAKMIKRKRKLLRQLGRIMSLDDKDYQRALRRIMAESAATA